MNEKFLIPPQQLPDEARDIARRAASLIEEVGWCQGALLLSDAEGNPTSFCVEGALRFAQFGKTLNFDRGEIDDPLRNLLWRAAHVFLAEKEPRMVAQRVTEWNDSRRRSAEEVVQFLLGLAEWQGEVTW